MKSLQLSSSPPIERGRKHNLKTVLAFSLVQTSGISESNIVKKSDSFSVSNEIVIAWKKFFVVPAVV